MAKIIATFDTVDKTIEVTMDGEKVKDVASVYLYSQYDDKEKILTYQWKNCVVGFNLPIAFNYNGKKYQLSPMDYIPQKKLITQADFDIKEFVKLINRLYYVNTTIEK